MLSRVGSNQPPLIVVEVAVSETLNYVVDKTKNVWLPMPTVLGVLVLDITESPKYSIPKPPICNEVIPQELWSKKVVRESLWGGFKLEGHQ